MGCDRWFESTALDLTFCCRPCCETLHGGPFHNLFAYNPLANVLQEAQEAVRTAENQRIKALAEAQAEASAALAKAEKDAAATLQDALAKAAQMAQQQETQAKQAAEVARQQVCTMLKLME
jgi:F0F1-type ATP synthase membrane subunit b/b'